VCVEEGRGRGFHQEQGFAPKWQCSRLHCAGHPMLLHCPPDRLGLGAPATSKIRAKRAALLLLPGLRALHSAIAAPISARRGIIH
jgi:hypothetical protein